MRAQNSYPSIRRVAEDTVEVGVLDGNRTAGLDCCPHPLQEIERAAQVLEQEAAEHQVIGFGFLPVVHVRQPELDVRHTALERGGAGEIELHLVHVDPGDEAFGADDPRDLEGHGAAAAAEIESVHPLSEPDGLEELGGIRPARAGEHLEPLVSLDAAADHVSLHAPIVQTSPGSVLESPRHSETHSLAKGGTVTSTDTGLGIEAKSDAIYELVEEGAQVERVATGFTFTEGPIWHPTEHYLLFSDMPGDVRRKYTPDGKVVEVRNFSNKCNGMTYDADLNLLVCEHVTSSLVKESPDGSREIIAQEFEGEELNSPNDVCVHSSGAIYFSDPWYGRMPGFGHPRKRRLGFQGVYRIAPGGGDPELIVGRDEYEMPNGICFSPDESLFYINDTPGAYIKVYDAAPDGSISNGRMFFEGVGSGVIEEGIPDGMKCDERGNIWVTGPGGVWVISAAGEHLGTILVPENTGNMTWGGEDWHTLFIPSSTSLYTIRTKVGPRREPYMR